MAGILYVVATPIGNLEDITLRALRILREVDVIVAEDTRMTAKLLNHYDIQNTLLSYHQQSNEKKKLDILNLLMQGKNLALVTDAGTPGISDPGNELISYLLLQNLEIKIIPVPGASAVTTLLSVCGANVSKFSFLGFLPKKKANRELKRVQEIGQPFVFYESPYRIAKTMQLLSTVFSSETHVVIGRELTKIHEEIVRGTLEEVQQTIKTTDRRGEYVVLVVPQIQKHGHSSNEVK